MSQNNVQMMGAQKEGKNSESTRWENRKLIIRMIKKAGVTTRKELAQMTGLQPATITIIMKEFLEKGIVEEVGLVEGNHGRRLKGFQIVNTYCIIAVRITRHHVTIAIYDIDYKILFCKTLKFETMNRLDETCDTIARVLEDAKESYAGRTVMGVGVTVAEYLTLVDHRYQCIDSRDGSFFDLGAELGKRLHCWVVVNKACNFTAYYLWMKEWKRNHGVVASLHIGNTVECGIMVNGEILTGSSGSAGAIGELLLQAGKGRKRVKLDDLLTTPGNIERAASLVKKHPDSVLAAEKEITVNALLRAYAEEDDVATELFDGMVKQIGIIVGWIVLQMNPDLFYVGGDIPQLNKYYSRIYAEVRKNVPEKIAVHLVRSLSDGSFKQFDVERPEKDAIDVFTTGATRNDPVLLGIAEYVIDMTFCERQFFE